MKKFAVLIVDNEELMRNLLDMVLRSEFNCETMNVQNGELAIEILKSGKTFSLIISDYYMPESDGGKVYYFNKNLDNVPFFLFSGGDYQDYIEFSDFKNVNRLNRFFNKPFLLREFIEAVKQVEESILSDKVLSA